MARVLEVVYEDGVLKPLADPGLAEHQRVMVEIRMPSEGAADAELAHWFDVYTGLSDSDITEVEAIALDRSRFSREP